MEELLLLASEKLLRIDIVHLVLVESGYLQLAGVFALFLSIWVEFLLKLNTDGTGMREGLGIRVVIVAFCVVFIRLALLRAKLETILVISSRLSPWIFGLAEVETPSEAR